MISRASFTSLQSRTANAVSVRGSVRVMAEKPKARVTKEYREGDDAVTEMKAEGNAESQAAEQADKEQRGIAAESRDPMSDEFKARLRKEYVGLGGTPNTPINNYFLYIIVGITGLVLACAALGYI